MHRAPRPGTEGLSGRRGLLQTLSKQDDLPWAHTFPPLTPTYSPAPQWSSPPPPSLGAAPRTRVPASKSPTFLWGCLCHRQAKCSLDRSSAACRSCQLLQVALHLQILLSSASTPPVFPPSGYLKAMSGPALCWASRMAAADARQLRHHPPAHWARDLLPPATTISIVLICTGHTRPNHPRHTSLPRSCLCASLRCASSTCSEWLFF